MENLSLLELQLREFTKFIESSTNQHLKIHLDHFKHALSSIQEIILCVEEKQQCIDKHYEIIDSHKKAIKELNALENIIEKYFHENKNISIK